MNRFLVLLVALLWAFPAMASDLESTNWSETAASNINAAPNGWPSNSPPTIVYQTDREMMGALKRWWNRANPTITSGGSANVQTLTYTTAPGALVQGQTYTFIAGFTNTGSATLNVNSTGAKAVQIGGAALTGGEIVSGAMVTVAYDGTQYQIISLPSMLTSVVKYAGNPITVSSSVLNVQNSSTTWQTLYALLHGSNTVANGVQVAIVNPASATVLETDAYNFQVENQSAHSAGVGNAVGIRGDVYGVADSSFTWWANPGLSDSITGTCAGCNARDLELMEVDVAIKSANTTFHGIVFTGSSTANPAGATAVSAGCLSGSTDATTGLCLAQYSPAPFVVPSGVTTVGLSLGATAAASASASANSNSESITQAWVDGSNVGQTFTQQVLANGGSPYLNMSGGGTAGFGMAVVGVGAITQVFLNRNDTQSGSASNLVDIFGGGKNSAAAGKNYTQIRFVALNTTSGSESGRISMFTANGSGTLTEYFRISNGAVALQNSATFALAGQMTFQTSTTGANTQTFTNSPCAGTTTEKWIPVSITGQTGTWNIPACQ